MILLRNNQTYLQANTYILADSVKKQALVVDPGAGSHAWVPAALEKRGLELSAVLLTHGHADHIWDVSAVAGDKPVYLPSPDRYLLDDPLAAMPFDPSRELVLSRLGAGPFTIPAGLQDLPAPAFSTSIEVVPGIWTRALPTPGHTPGSTVFLFEGDPDVDPESPMESTGRVEPIMLSADVIFNNGVGRTDLPGGDPEKMAASLRLLVQVIKPETYIFPGHGEPTTMFHETRHSPYLHSAMS